MMTLFLVGCMLTTLLVVSFVIVIVTGGRCDIRIQRTARRFRVSMDGRGWTWERYETENARIRRTHNERTRRMTYEQRIMRENVLRRLDRYVDGDVD